MCFTALSDASIDKNKSTKDQIKTGGYECNVNECKLKKKLSCIELPLFQ